MLINRPCDQFLAGACFASDQNGDGCGCDFRQLPIDASHGAALTDQRILLLINPADLHRFGHLPSCADGLFQDAAQFLYINRFGQKIISAALHRADGHVAVAGARHQQNGQPRLLQMQACNELQSTQPAQAILGHHSIEIFRNGPLQTLGAVFY